MAPARTLRNGRLRRQDFERCHPAELLVEQPTRLQFLLNLKAAKALGLDVPISSLLRADQVIE